MKALTITGMALALCLSATAGTIYNSTGNSLDGQDSMFPSGTDVNGNEGRGPAFNSFISSSSPFGSVLNDVQLSLYAASHGTGSVGVGLYTNAGGNNVGALVASLGTVSDSSVNLCASTGSACTGAASLIDLSGLSVALTAGNLYWIGLTPNGALSTTILWNWSDDNVDGTGVAGGGYSNNTGTFGFGGTGNSANFPYLMSIASTDNPNPNASGTPEPATFVMIGSGFLALGLFRRLART